MVISHHMDQCWQIQQVLQVLCTGPFLQFPLKGQQDAEYLIDCTHAKAEGVLQLDFFKPNWRLEICPPWVAEVSQIVRQKCKVKLITSGIAGSAKPILLYRAVSMTKLPRW